MVGTDDAVSPNATLEVDRADEREIGKMAAAGVRIIEEEQLAGTRLEVAHGRDGVGQRPQMHGDVRRLRDHLAIRIEQRRRGVAPLAGCSVTGRCARARDPSPRRSMRCVRHDLETDGVEPHVRSRITAPDACTMPRQPGSTRPVASGPREPLVR